MFTAAPGVAEVAGVAVATSRNSKVDGDCEAAVPLERAKPAGRHGTVAGVAGVAIATARNSKGEERAIDEPGHDSLLVSEHLAIATPATPCFVESGAVARARNPKTGEFVPHRLAMVAPAPSDEFRAQLGSFRSRTNPQELHLVDILCPAYSGGLKGLTFRVDQLPGLIRVLLQAHNKAIESGLLSPDIPSDQLELSGKS